MKSTKVLENIDAMARSLYAFTKQAEELGDRKVELVWETLSDETRAFYQEEACRQYLEQIGVGLPKLIYNYLNKHSLVHQFNWDLIEDDTKALYTSLVKDLGLVSTIAPEE